MGQVSEAVYIASRDCIDSLVRLGIAYGLYPVTAFNFAVETFQKTDYQMYLASKGIKMTVPLPLDEGTIINVIQRYKTERKPLDF